MGPDNADQLAPLGAVFADVYGAIRPARLALIGCATGNGLEHVDPQITKEAIAIDLNPLFVEKARMRHSALGRVLDVRCADVTSCVLPSAYFDLIHVALVFEHVDANALVPRLASWLSPGGTCGVVLQVDGRNDAESVVVTPSPCRSMAALATTMRVISSERVAALFDEQKLHRTRHFAVPLRGGKRLDVGEYSGGVRPAAHGDFVVIPPRRVHAPTQA